MVYENKLTIKSKVYFSALHNTEQVRWGGKKFPIVVIPKIESNGNHVQLK